MDISKKLYNDNILKRFGSIMLVTDVCVGSLFFESFPLELQTYIINMLNIESLIRLGHCSKYFARMDISPLHMNKWKTIGEWMCVRRKGWIFEFAQKELYWLGEKTIPSDVIVSSKYKCSDRIH